MVSPYSGRANHIYLFIRTTLELGLIVFRHWTDPLANERLMGTDGAQDHERVINRGERRKKVVWRRRLG